MACLLSQYVILENAVCSAMGVIIDVLLLDQWQSNPLFPLFHILHVVFHAVSGNLIYCVIVREIIKINCVCEPREAHSDEKV